MGQAAGTAAAIAIRERRSPRALFPAYIDELQQTLLADGAYLLGIRNWDPADLALSATGVKASSRATGIDRQWVVTPISNWGIVHPLDTARAVLFRAREARINSLALFLRSQSSEATALTVRLCHTWGLGDFNSGQELACGVGRVPPNSAGWVDFDLSSLLAPGEFYYLALPATPGIEWELYSYHPPETLRGYHGPAWGALWGCYKFRLNPGGEPPPAAAQGPYEFVPKNLLDGFSRAVHGQPCSWAPDPAAPLPQWVDLEFPRRIHFNTAQFTFQLAALAPEEYELLVRCEGQWRCVLHVHGNRYRRRVHVFGRTAADAVRFSILARQSRAGTPLTPVCEIRLYDGP